MTLPGEEQVRLANKMYDVREFCRRVRGDKYEDEIASVVKMLRKRAGEWDIDELLAAKRIIEEAKEEGNDEDGGITMWITAAAVESTETGDVG